MRILVVAATSLEIAPLVQRLSRPAPVQNASRPAPVQNAWRPALAGPEVPEVRLKADATSDSKADATSDSKDERLIAYVYRSHDVDVLVTGVGMVATAAWTSRVLAETRYDFALNLGVCGSFNPALPLGGVVHVVSDRIAELGAEDDDRFLPIEELGLPTEYRFVNALMPDNPVLRGLPIVNGITVNTVHGSEESIAAVVRRFDPDVESMEGAGFMQACQIHGVVRAQVRAVSNVVGKRNRAAWRLDEAIAGVCGSGLEILDTV
jgi:futalosine hydrolase